MFGTIGSFLYVLCGYLLILNIAGFCSMGIDKKRAKNGQWRISEKTLFLIAIFGGSIGSLVGMRRFRHKTKHTSFVVGMPLILLIQIGFTIAIANVVLK